MKKNARGLHGKWMLESLMAGKLVNNFFPENEISICDKKLALVFQNEIIFLYIKTGCLLSISQVQGIPEDHSHVRPGWKLLDELHRLSGNASQSHHGDVVLVIHVVNSVSGINRGPAVYCVHAKNCQWQKWRDHPVFKHNFPCKFAKQLEDVQSRSPSRVELNRDLFGNRTQWYSHKSDLPMHVFAGKQS